MTTPTGAGIDPAMLGLLAQWQREEATGLPAKVVVTMGPWTAWCTISALQLAWRHPDMSDGVKDTIRSIGEQLARPFNGLPGEHLARGWDLTQDHATTCRDRECVGECRT